MSLKRPFAERGLEEFLATAVKGTMRHGLHLDGEHIVLTSGKPWARYKLIT